MTKREVFQLLEDKYAAYCRPEFIESDPISIPHRFEQRNDIEISGLLAATIAWGQRPTIIKNALSIMDRMGNEPCRFVMEHTEADLRCLNGFVHRTFNAEDLKHFVRSLKHLYSHHASLEDIFVAGCGPLDTNLKHAIAHFRTEFFSTPHIYRTQKHVSDPMRGSAAKRLNMFLRWMVRPSDRGVDFGLWNRIPTSLLSCPLDVHSGRNARDLGLLKRQQNDWQAVEELDESLKFFDPLDPVKYDFALFGLGVYD